VLFATTSEKGLDNDWILDSSCTYYICPHRDLFAIYDPVNTEIVLISNNIECKVAGIGTVQIKTHDRVVRTLPKVCYIPDMTCNLISLGAFEANDCRYSVDIGVLKVMRGAIVLIKGLRQGSLYLLQGTTVTGLAAVCTTSTDVDTTRLWHI